MITIEHYKRTFLTVLFALNIGLTGTAQYILTDDNVVVTDGIILSCSYSFDSTNIIIPEIIDGQAVTGIASIGFGVFYRKGIKSIELPSSIETIGNFAFYDNEMISLNLNANTSLTSIGDNAFLSNQISSLDISQCNNLTFIGKGAFSGNGLSNFTLPINSNYTIYGWKDGYGNLYDGGDIVSDYSTFYYVPITYTLTDNDVIVTDGIIQSCSYNFELCDIIIPDTLDGQKVIGIADKDQEHGVFYNKAIQGITLPTTIEHIGNYAFYRNALATIDLSACSALISIGNYAFRANSLSGLDLSACTALTSIGNYAFVENVLTNLVLSPAIDSIGNDAFYWNNLTSLDLSTCTTLVSIGENAFYRNQLINIDLSGCTSLTYIGKQAFNYNKLTDLDLSACTALTYIGNSAFSYNWSLSYIILPTNSEYAIYGWKNSDGTFYNGGDTITDYETHYYVPVPHTLTDEDVVVTGGIIQSCSYNFELVDIIVPKILDGQTVVGIADNKVFMGGVFRYKGIKSIILPSTIEMIGRNAFGSNDLTSLNLSACIALISIGDEAFKENNLTDLILPSSLEIIGNEAFSLNELEKINLNVLTALAYIGSDAFYANPLTDFNIPVNTEFNQIGWKDNTGITYNGGDMVSDLRLTYFVPKPYTLKDFDVEVSEGIIQSCSYRSVWTNIIIPENLDGQIILGIDYKENYDGVFNNKDIVAIDLPSTIVYIGDNAFIGNNLTTLDLSTCSALTTIGNHAFRENDLTDLILPSSIEIIGHFAFNNNLLSVLDLSAYTALYYIGSGAFTENSISGFNLPVNTAYDSLGWKDESGNLWGGGDLIDNLNLTYIVPKPYILTDDDVVVTDGIIQSSSYNIIWTNIIIPDTLDGQEVIGIADDDQGVFCFKDMTSLILPATIKTIGDGAFSYNFLTNLDLSVCTKLISIGYRAFCDNELINVNMSTCTDIISIGEEAFINNSLNSLDLTSCTELAAIGKGAFCNNSLTSADLSNCTSLTSVSERMFASNKLRKIYLPSTIVSIGKNAFEFNNLQSIDLSDYKDLIRIGEYAFAINQIKSLVLPSSIKTISGYAFYSNLLSSLDLSTCTDLSVIDYWAFSYNSISVLNLSGCSSLISINEEAFTSNELTNLDLSGCKKLISIGDRAFFYNKLVSLNLDGCTSLSYIYDSAFYDNELTSIELSACKSLRHIGIRAFSYNYLTSFELPTPDIPGYILSNWIDIFGNTYFGGEIVTNLYCRI
jgi:hypothetical protein